MTSNTSPDYDAKAYAAERPTYTPELQSLILDYHQGGRDLAVDVGTGTGQMATLISGDFKTIHAYDALPAMIEQAIAIPNVKYGVSKAENLPEKDGTVDLIVSAEAAHWFDPKAFEAEVTRLLRPGGTVALVGYSWMHILDHPTISEVIKDLGQGRFGSYWAQGREVLDGRYAVYTFPSLRDVDRKTWEGREGHAGVMGEQSLTPASLRAFLRTWSPYKKWKEMGAPGKDPIDEVIELIRNAGIAEDESFRIAWDQVLVLARKPLE
ncbi:S-adenosyl-L-methionine-dependent methyltransferase [Piptocephalis cylindrospora]|uniref:S-adenosyl-L-methionine-dependent methyltransferase n=1 Tax=Piptocephalis cylindrospora TaxID=1907219 RepID=A0A4P9XZU7_9FUNG|nr:S-adenosyl-L-methionine-dependent methyltransferase [Piptocephalis cylindrospora]|eukprot:RKP11682.1 S-adenosyl-L-methionine-dependent methyltransferase [Piptocephalis cylindrospora]